MTRILIIEPLCSGHRSNYVRWSATAFRRQGHAVQIATLDKSASRLLPKELRETDGPIDLLKLSDNDLRSPKGVDSFSLARKELAYWRLFRKFYLKSAATVEPDLVFIPYADYCINAISIKGSPFRSTPWAGIVMRPAFHFAEMSIVGPRPKLGAAKEKLFKRVLGNRTLRSLFTIDEGLHAYCQKTFPPGAEKLHYLADPAESAGNESKSQARQALGISDKPIILLVYGSLSLRKGVGDLLRAALRPDWPREIEILLAGRQDQTISDLLKSEGMAALIENGRVRQINRFMTADEEFKAFAASDIVWLGYRGHYYMSGVMVQAGQMGLPIIACDEGLVGWLSREHDLGTTISVTDTDQVIGAVKHLIDDTDRAQEYGKNGRRTFAGHTPERFADAILGSLS